MKVIGVMNFQKLLSGCFLDNNSKVVRHFRATEN
ncbi:hypothetical protein M2326_002338 [Flavobacterium sp. 7A]|nr:hypothetical protein [Flavobacterium sp. 7A]